MRVAKAFAKKIFGKKKLAPKPKDESGSYTNTHESGTTYDGKGTLERAKQSAREKEKKYNDPVTDIDHTPATTHRDGFKDESRRMDKTRKAGTPSYNKRESPGKKYRSQDGENNGL